MVNETLQDIFDEFYAREAKIQEKGRIRELEEQIEILNWENNLLEDERAEAEYSADVWEESYYDIENKLNELKAKLKKLTQ